MDLRTRYLGLELDNPFIVGSSGLTGSLAGVQRCAAAGAGAVVLKSIFEEEIVGQVEALLRASEPASWHTEAAEYLSHYGEAGALEGALRLIREAKQAVRIPVIASVHCASAGAWTRFAAEMAGAGADALELNVFVMPADPSREGAEIERLYFDILREVKARVDIPVALKVGSFFSGMAKTLRDLSYAGAGALVLFNRFYRWDIDIETRRLVPARVYSEPGEMAESLRWVSILAGRVGCDLAAGTGIHDGAGAVKQLLAGATALQVCSVLYKRDIEYLGTMRGELEAWMRRQGYSALGDFRGLLRQAESNDPTAYERAQFMKAVAGVG